MQETRDALSKRAYAAILSSQQHLESLNDVQYDSLKQKLTMRLDALRELMVHFSKDDGKIIKAVEDLEAVSI